VRDAPPIFQPPIERHWYRPWRRTKIGSISLAIFAAGEWRSHVPEIRHDEPDFSAGGAFLNALFASK
jgi:hypothetical protein